MSYETYRNMSAMQKDLVYEGFEIQQHNDNEKKTEDHHQL